MTRNQAPPLDQVGHQKRLDTVKESLSEEGVKGRLLWNPGIGTWLWYLNIGDVTCNLWQAKWDNYEVLKHPFFRVITIQ